MEWNLARIIALALAAGLVLLVVRHRRSLTSGVLTYLELIQSLWRGPHWWLVPVVLLFIPTVIVLVLLESVPVVAPFVYTVF